MAKNAFFKNLKIWVFGPPKDGVLWSERPKNDLGGHFWAKTYLWTEFHRNRGRWLYWALYKNVPISHGRPLKSHDQRLRWHLVYKWQEF